MKPRTIIFPITPQTWVSFDKNNSAVFRIPEECQSRKRITGLEEDKGKPCDHYSEENPYCYHIDEKGKKIMHTLSKWGRYIKRRVKKYNEYKDKLRELAEEKNFEFEIVGVGIMFHLPMPKRWTKTKKRHRHLSWHDYTPDLSNMTKAFEDALKKQDKFIAFYSHLGKKWVNFEEGWIEITLPKKNEYDKIQSVG